MAVKPSHIKVELNPETFSDMIARIEQAMRPLGEQRYGPDHERVQVLYDNLLQTCTGDAWTLARRAVLYEILHTAAGAA